MSQIEIPAARPPMWLPMLALLGIAWNVFGTVQLVDYATRTHEGLMMQGLAPEAAQLYNDLPFWMTIAFAIGSIGGLIGSVLLLVRHRLTLRVLAVSLAGYLTLFMGDVIHGVFKAIPAQLAILTTVVLFAAALLSLAWVAKQRGYMKSSDHPPSFE